ncbi:hypothetical protein C4565_01135 [Candidatus Parcubacteria bacterium]|jgi:Ca2+/Na+ antiporter|nr:MAG: hypothetical protein C4565_01135 [Candidatus Parcubacteria bacterium]
MDSQKQTAYMFLAIFLLGFLYVFLTYKSPYEQAIALENRIKEEMKDIENAKIPWIVCNDSTAKEIEKGDYLYIEESFVRVDTVNTDSLGVYSPKGLFDLSKQDVALAKSFLFKKGTLNYEYAKRGMILEEVEKKKKQLEKSEKKE